MSHQCTITDKDIEDKLVVLREKWRDNPMDRRIILRQARALQIAKEKLIKRKHPYQETTSFLDKE